MTKIPSVISKLLENDAVEKCFIVLEIWKLKVVL